MGLSAHAIQKLTGDLDESQQQRALFEKQLAEAESDSKRQVDTDRKQMEGRLKVGNTIPSGS